ncbi:hypothetical protein CK934_02485 [Chitinophaga sp. MD30]|nr:hypothetical protein CK934_02485 [Chitinophaga sp. MD30]
MVALLVLAWMCQAFSRYWVMADFYMNRDFIAKTLCINRDKPMMHCNGHCQLKKRMNDQERKDNENPERKAENKNEVFYTQHIINSITPAFIFIVTACQPGNAGMPVDRSSCIFHPPLA